MELVVFYEEICLKEGYNRLRSYSPELVMADFGPIPGLSIIHSSLSFSRKVVLLLKAS